MEFPNIKYKYILSLFDSLKTLEEVYEAVFHKISEKVNYNFSSVEIARIKSKIRKVKASFHTLSLKNHGHKDRFVSEFEEKTLNLSINNPSINEDNPGTSSLSLNENSLDSFVYNPDNVISEDNFVLSEIVISENSSAYTSPDLSDTNRDLLIKKKRFCDYAPRTKRQKIEEAHATILNDLQAAFHLLMRTAKKLKLPNMAELIHQVSKLNEKEAKEASNLLEKNPKPLSNIEAVSFMHEYSLSVNTYIKIQRDLKGRNHNVLPSYNLMKFERYACHPAHITASSVSVEAPVEDVVRHTVARLLLEHVEVLCHLIKNKPVLFLIFTCSLGMDGSSEMAFFDSEQLSNNSTNILSTTLSYLLLYEVGSNKLIFNNLQASSTRTNRPVKLVLTKETKENCKEEFERVKHALDNLLPLEFEIHGMRIVVTVDWIFSQIDGKVLSALTDTRSTQVCQLCLATPLMFNTFRFNRQECVFDSKKLIFGLGSLHLLLRSYGFFLDLGVRGTCKKWRRTKKQIESQNTNKRRIQQEMKERLNLYAMFPKGNLGSSDTGNAARKAFKEHKIFAEILRINPELIERFYIILTAISVQYFVNIEKFRTYLQETEALYLKVIFLTYFRMIFPIIFVLIILLFLITL